MQQFLLNREHTGKSESNLPEMNISDKGQKNIRSTYDTILKCSPFALAIKDVHSEKIIEVNALFEDLIGYSREEIIGKTISTIVKEENIEGDLLNHKTDKHSTTSKYYKKDGTAIWVKITKTLLQDNEKTYLMSSFVDLTAEMEVETRLRKSELQYRKLFDHSLNAIAVYDFDKNRFTDCNTTFTNIYGYVTEDLKDISVVDLAWTRPNEEDPIYKQRYEDNLVRLRRNETIRFESNHKTKDGQKLIVNVVLIPFYVEDKLFAKQITTDVTEQKLARESLDQKIDELNVTNNKLKKYIESNLQLENFAYITSHDLREPIRTIIGFSQILNRRLGEKLSPEDRESLDFITNASKNLHTLVQDILAFSKVNGQNANFESIKTQDILMSVLADLRVMTEKGDVEIQLSEQYPEQILGHRTYLYQLFQNLIKNAAKFKKEHEKAVVKVYYEDLGDHHKFSVEDNGIGIKEEHFDKIFMMFKKLNGKNKYGGSGIGLSISKKVVQLHEGNIWVDSKLGEGTTFHFTIKKELTNSEQ